MRPCLGAAVVLFFVAAMAACVPAEQEPQPVVEMPDTTEADVAAIEELADEYFAAVNTGDAERYLACFADDAIWMPPNEPLVAGKQAWTDANPDAFADFTLDLTAMHEEVQVVGDWAFVRNGVTGTFTPSEGDPVQVDGKGIWILQRQADGSWKISHTIRNGNLPLAGGEE